MRLQESLGGHRRLRERHTHPVTCRSDRTHREIRKGSSVWESLGDQAQASGSIPG